MENKVILVGKGPSSRKIPKSNDYSIACLNNAVILCEEVDYLFINDFEILDLLNEIEWNKVKNIILPTYPHFNVSPHRNLPYQSFLDAIPNRAIKYDIHRLDTCLDKDPNVPYLGKSYSVGTTAIQWLGKNGCKELDFCGIDPEGGYNPIFDILNENNQPKNHACRAESGTAVYQTNYNLFLQIAESFNIKVNRI